MDVRDGAAGSVGGTGGTGPARRPSGAAVAHSVAAAWGLAEATLFFIVPDVWLTAIGLRDLRRGLVACGWALVGALAGGAAMYLWGAASPVAAGGALERVPAISPGMLERVAGQLAEHGAAGTLLGPLLGTPYKTYAALAPAAGVGLLPFLLVSVPARLARFLLLVAGAHWIAHRLMPDAPHARRLAVLLLAWATFYAGYFALVPS